ncbi:hypothetical protein [Okeania sp.]|nr:hypothetical protein [Okeania sp.]
MLIDYQTFVPQVFVLCSTNAIPLIKSAVYAGLSVANEYKTLG